MRRLEWRLGVSAVGVGGGVSEASIRRVLMYGLVASTSSVSVPRVSANRQVAGMSLGVPSHNGMNK